MTVGRIEVSHYSYHLIQLLNLSIILSSLVHPDELVRFCYHQFTDKSNENTVLTGLILRLIRARKTYMSTYMSLFSGISPQMLAARVAYTAQVSVARLSQLPHLVLHSLALADMAGRALTKTHKNCVCTSRGRPEAVLFMLKYGRGFASPFFLLFSPLICHSKP